MKEIDEFLNFLLEHESDERISFSKKMKYGYRHYYVSFNIDDKPEDDIKKQSYVNSLRGYSISESVEIIVDNRIACIELIYDNFEKKNMQQFLQWCTDIQYLQRGMCSKQM
jgi:hypothetical protein